MANIWRSAFSIINWSNIWSISSNKSFKNSTGRGSKKVKLLLLILVLSSCTIGGEKSQGVATIESSTATTILEEETTFEEGILDFAQCMRVEGIDFPDPTFDIDGNPQFDNLEIENEEEFESAFESCEDILRNALPEQFDLDPEVEAALVDASLEFSQCMREQGIDFPDPKPGEFGFFAFRDADIDFTSEAVQEAFEICQPENPLENLDD